MKPNIFGPRPMDWQQWRMCPVCRATIGQPCYSLSGRITTDGDGLSVPDGVRTVLAQPHRTRLPRKRR